MDPCGNPIASTSWAGDDWNPDVEEALQVMISQDDLLTDPNILSPNPLTDEELFGILSGNVINDEMEIETDSEEDIVHHERDFEDDIQNETTDIRHDGWHPGNPPRSSTGNINFSKTSGLKVEVTDTPISYFEALCTEPLLQLLVTNTNTYGANEVATCTVPKSRKMLWKPTSCAELKLFLGLLFHMGFIKMNRICDYWKKDLFFNQAVFTKCMTRNRFLNILRMLCVHVGQTMSSYAKVKSIIDFFNNRISEIYYPTKNITIDESMMLWRGRLGFRQYMKGKRHKYGLKFYALADQLGVIMKLHLYGGASDVLVGGTNHVKKVVNHLMAAYINVGHHLFIDNFYTSVDLTEQLYTTNTYCTGTMRENRKNNPANVVKAKLKKGELCIQHKNNICFIKWKDQRDVLAISSKYNGELLPITNRRGQIKIKPHMVIEYNKNMKGIDRHDQMMAYYSCEHKSLRWYKKVIVHIMQVILINSFFLYNKFGSQKTTLYDFRLSVIKALVEPHMPSEPPRPIGSGRVHLPVHLELDAHGKTKRKRCAHCWSTIKKRINTLFACRECPGQPGLCIKCFRSYHKY